MLITDDVKYNKFKLDNPMHDENTLIKNHKKSQSGGCYKLKETKVNNKIISYQSELENDFIKYCVEHNIEIENGDIIDYWFNDTFHKYYIDFKIKINNVFHLVELKSLHKWYCKDLKNGKLNTKENYVKQYNNSVGYGKFIFILDDNKLTKTKLFQKHLIN